MRTVEMSKCLTVSLVVGTLALGQAMGKAVDYPETVPVGNPNNVPDGTGYGPVAYKYRIAKYEVTNEQYVEFLNATAKSGNVGYRWQMGKHGVSRHGGDGSYEYSIKEGLEKRPAVLMNWHEVLRFCNWLSNGKGKGSTETGPYKFVDEWGEKTVKMPDHAKLAAGTNTQWVLASEDEWYKAAYYDPKKSDGSGGYWPYPSPSDNPPDANLSSGRMMDVGSFTTSASAYGTFDQGGNVWEWNETRSGGNCGVRGGSYWHNDGANYMAARTRYCTNPAWFVYDNYGFRVVALGADKAKAKKK